jgi:hypothetical protein
VTFKKGDWVRFRGDIYRVTDDRDQGCLSIKSPSGGPLRQTMAQELTRLSPEEAMLAEMVDGGL